jgi:hypothetical protein
MNFAWVYSFSNQIFISPESSSPAFLILADITRHFPSTLAAMSKIDRAGEPY